MLASQPEVALQVVAIRRIVVVAVEHGQINFAGAAVDRSHGQDAVHVGQLLHLRALAVHSQHLFIGQQRQSEIVVARQVAAEHKRAAEDGEEGHQAVLLVFGKAGVALGAPFSADRDVRKQWITLSSSATAAIIPKPLSITARNG